MKLQELCSLIPKLIVRETEAVQLLRASMDAISKVHKNAEIYYDESQDGQEAILKAIENEISSLNGQMIAWKGVYGKPPVEYWFFMHGLLVMRGTNQLWMFMGRKLTKRDWQKILEA